MSSQSVIVSVMCMLKPWGVIGVKECTPILSHGAVFNLTVELKKKKVTPNVYLYTRHQTIQGNSLMQITDFTYIWGHMRLRAVSQVGLTGFKSPLGDVRERELNA